MEWTMGTESYQLLESEKEDLTSSSECQPVSRGKKVISETGDVITILIDRGLLMLIK